VTCDEQEQGGTKSFPLDASVLLTASYCWLYQQGISTIIHPMSATEATAEVFVTAFKALKRKEREAVLQKLVADARLADDLTDTLALEARRHQPHEPLREVLKSLRIRV